MAFVKAITIKLAEATNARLEKRARRIGMSKSALVRECIDRALDSVEEEPSAYDLMKDGFGCVKSQVSDLSTNPKHMEGFGR